MQLTPKDKNILAFIQEYLETTGVAPTREEIRSHFGYQSLTSVQRSIKSLTRKGYLKQAKNKSRGIALNQKNNEVTAIPVVGSVACGQPLMAIENIQGYIQTDIGFLKAEPSRFFYLVANGDSMNQAGIDDGDLILVRSQTTADDGDLVVALIEDKATIKKIKFGDSYVKLQPLSSNPVHQPIILRRDFTIQGVVVRVIKN